MSISEELKKQHNAKDDKGICDIYDSLSDEQFEHLTDWDFVYLMRTLSKKRQ